MRRWRLALGQNTHFQLITVISHGHHGFSNHWFTLCSTACSGLQWRKYKISLLLALYDGDSGRLWSVKWRAFPCHDVIMNNCWCPGDTLRQTSVSRMILSLRPANEGRHYKVTPSLIGWAQTSNQLCILVDISYQAISVHDLDKHKQQIFHWCLSCGCINSEHSPGLSWHHP